MKSILRRCMLWGGIVVTGIALTTTAFAEDTYQIDSVHSSIGFSVKHLSVSTVRGEFTDYTGSITYDPADLSDA